MLKIHENRVALTPAGAKELSKPGQIVLVETRAGEGSGFSDEDYLLAGASISNAVNIWGTAEMIVKVKEPVAAEYALARRDQLLFTYFHFAASEALTIDMIESGAVCLAYETVERADGSLPLLVPMSEV